LRLFPSPRASGEKVSVRGSWRTTITPSPRTSQRSRRTASR
jgi:hypothetical protein